MSDSQEPVSQESPNRPACECVGCCGSVGAAGKDKGPAAPADLKTPWISRHVATAAGPVPVVATRLSRRDKLGSLRARLAFGRMDYRVPPGLYAVGAPTPASLVFVSANYKLSFDRLRRELDGLDAWILVLDTNGINVWCAAGKGTFGTEELVQRIATSRLAEVVSHRKLILPQLGAPGVAGHDVKKLTGFNVVYGPVRAADIKPFLAAGLKASLEMRRVRFGLKDRLVLTPVEILLPLKYAAIVAALLVLIRVLFGVTVTSWRAAYPYLGAVAVGTVLVPALLPWIPGRAFAWKGWLLGAAWAAAVNLYQGLIFSPAPNWPRAGVHFLLLPAISAFLAMYFTGSSTYTSLSGVVKEMKYALPAIAVSTAAGLILLVSVLAGVF
jgi:hypothetical protein